MTTLIRKFMPSSQPPDVMRSDQAPALPSGRRRMGTTTRRVRRDGKFFRLDNDKFFVKGLTYGPFAPSSENEPLPERDQVRKDFAQIRELGVNCVRLYHTPPRWFLDLAGEMGLYVFLDVAWPKNLTFASNPEVVRQAHAAVREAARSCGNHLATFAISVVNEIPPDIARFVGREKVQRFIDELCDIVKEEAPDCLVTFASFPTIEYIQPRHIDFVCFNVYLHDEQTFRNYLARLQNIAGEKPLMLGEYGIDTMREHTPRRQAEILCAHVRAVFDEGLAGTFIFCYTDDWFTGGCQIEDWAFGIVTRDRQPKPAFTALKPLLARVPQVSDMILPMVSVIVCSYNGASTVESCLRSLENLRYRSYEVVFVDDGSTDRTQEILRQFPWVRVIRQRNMGLSYARNVGMNAAKGDIIVYTDSDCEADEDWLYYLVLALVGSKHVGMGGPNLVPDEGSWVAACVGLAPGGPTHVMIDDRTAEHVPGCNMAFYTWAAKQANGFDSQFRKAGDDVDFIWRLQHLGYTIGFAPSAQVWHYRRNTVEAYLRQQRGYGEAEALLKYKHPDHFNTLGASHWRGRIYGSDQIGVRIGGDVIYHGLFGTALFQTIYRRQASMVAALLMSVEWHLLGMFVTLLGALAYTPLLYLAAFMFLTPVILALVAAAQSPPPRHRHWLWRPLLALLHFRQPIARGWARYSVRLRTKTLKLEAAGHRRPHELPFDPNEWGTLRYWNPQQDRLPLLGRIKDAVAAAGWRMRMDAGWAGWDLEIYGSRYVKVRLTTATETHRRNSMVTRVRVELLMSTFYAVLLGASLMLSGLLLMHNWPASRTAVLIPLAWWALFLVSKLRVSRPVLGLIDEAAEEAGYVRLNEGKEVPRPDLETAAPVANHKTNDNAAH